MAAAGAPETRTAWNRGSASGFHWVSSSPSPAKVIELETRFPDVIQIPASMLEASADNWKDNALIARTFSRWVPPDAFVREFRRSGVPGEIHTVCLAHRCFIFRFESPGAKDLVAARPWVVNGQPVAIEEWRPEFIPAEDSISSILLWVRLPSLPLEFWADAILAAILAPAGQFVCSDSATKGMTRGAFARACVRIDLRQPLRPGVRVQGVASPFWQSFQFEHLDGICHACGSIHLSGHCAVPTPSSPAENSVSSPLFGPWMSATRQRVPADSVRKKQAASPPVESVNPLSSVSRPGTSSEGWIVPAKMARRRSKVSGTHRDGSAIVPSVPLGGKAPSQASAGSSCAISPVPAENNSEGLVVALKPDNQLVSYNAKNPGIKSLDSNNPFALLSDGCGDCRTPVRMDVNPGPSKRARPEESLSQRGGIKGGNRKGKGIVSGSKESIVKPIFTDSVTTGQGPGSDVTKLGKSSKGEVLCHDSILSGLKLAIKDQGMDPSLPAFAFRATGSASGADSREADSCQMECIAKVEGGNAQTGGFSSDMAVGANQGEIHPPFIS